MPVQAMMRMCTCCTCLPHVWADELSAACCENPCVQLQLGGGVAYK